MNITLPWPPTANNLYLNGKRGRTLSPQGRDYCRRVWFLVSRHAGKFGEARLAVSIRAYPPDSRRRDLSNLPKCIEDALTKARLWADDCQIDDLRIVRFEPVKGGKVVVEVTELPEPITFDGPEMMPTKDGG